MTLALTMHPENPEPRKVRHAIEVLDAGGVAFYPTDTVYALGCALDAKKSVERLYRLKRMSEKQPLAMICGGLSDLARYAIVTDFAYRMMRRILPGPYTVVLAATREVPRLLLDRRRTIGIRVPKNPICEALVRELGRPLLTTSAIPPGAEAACLDVDAARAAWPSGIDLTIEGGPTPGEPSTVVSMIGDEIEVLREGLGPIEGVLV